jgi:hypothetical protein
MSAYFVRGSGEAWAVIRLVGRDEEVVADGLSEEDAVERCYELIEDLPHHAAELPLADGAPRVPERRRSRQLALKF